MSKLSTELQNGLGRCEFVPYFQPLVDLRTDTLSGFEILARWNHPTRGILMPNVFIPMLEESGLLSELTRCLLSQALVAARELPHDTYLSFNVATQQLQTCELLQTIETAAAKASFPLERLTVELTESALLNPTLSSRKLVRELKARGIKLALDDFGTGYSSLTQLQSLPFDILKVDQSFVRTMLQKRDSRKIIGAVIGLGKSLGLNVVAEGIEDKAQADMLLCLGCETGQGWLYGKAAPAKQVADGLTNDPARSHYAQSPPAAKVDAIVCLEALPTLNEAQLKAIYLGAPVGLCFLDCNFRYVSLNNRFAAMNGLLIEDHLGRFLQDVSPISFEFVEQYLLRARAGESLDGIEIERPNFSPPFENLTLVVSFYPVRDEENEVAGILVAATDISERKQIENQLKDTEQHYRSSVELNPQIPWTMDRFGKNCEVSSRWALLTGLPCVDSEGSAWLEALHEDDREQTRAHARNSVETGSPIDLEFRLWDKAGELHWIRSRGTPYRNADGEILRWYGIFELIDEQHRILDELQFSRDRLQGVIDALPVGIVIAEAPSGKIISRNPCAQRILKQDPIQFAEIGDYSDHVSYFREGIKLCAQDFPLAKALLHGESTTGERVFYDSGDGKGKWIELSGAPLKNGAGDIVGAVAALQEVRLPS